MTIKASEIKPGSKILVLNGEATKPKLNPQFTNTYSVGRVRFVVQPYGVSWSAGKDRYPLDGEEFEIISYPYKIREVSGRFVTLKDLNGNKLTAYYINVRYDAILKKVQNTDW